MQLDSYLEGESYWVMAWKMAQAMTDSKTLFLLNPKH